MMIKKGIYWAEKNRLNTHPHPIVVLGCDGEGNEIIACVLSTKPSSANDSIQNIQLSQCHFEEHDSSGQPYRINYAPSYLIMKKYIKIRGDINARVCGMLTDDGLEFIEKKLNDIRGVKCDNPIWRTDNH